MAFRVPSTIRDALCEWLGSHDYGPIIETTQVGGSGINQCYAVLTGNGRQCFVKTGALDYAEHSDDASYRHFYAAEAENLRLLARAQAVQTPKVLHATEQFLLLDYIGSGQQQRDYWSILGQQLAELHQFQHSQFGLERDNFCGATPQINGWYEDGFEFFGERRLLFQLRLAYDNALLDSPWVVAAESIVERLPELIPRQPASLLHGDLWSGNIHVGSDGEPVLIDPACYYGWREADLAMTQLFGSLPLAFYQAYDEAWRLEPGWQERVALYNLYHLLNHLNIFGPSYLPQVEAVISRYA